jgi:LysR family transcriptional regulator for metE and metH
MNMVHDHAVLEIRHLRSLIALAESGTVSRAAERVHLTQSALSHQLKALESRYGAPVVKRHGQSVKLTESGQRLVALARSVMGEVQSAERDLAKLAKTPARSLRIALECHTCFDWLMPIMDVFRKEWPEVELDLVSGFHPNPVDMLTEGKTDLVIGSENKPRRGIVFHPLFRFEILAVLPTDHALREKRYLSAGDFAKETLITYPVPEDRIDLVRKVLKPAGVSPKRRTAELTVAILQLVASRRGVAALPNWGIKNYVDYKYVIARSIGKGGLWSNLHAATTPETARQPFLRDFLETARRECFSRLDGVVPVQ